MYLCALLLLRRLLQRCRSRPRTCAYIVMHASAAEQHTDPRLDRIAASRTAAGNSDAVGIRRIRRGASYFLSGVMGGSGSGSSSALGITMEPQDYRAEITAAIRAADATAVVIDPLVMGAERAASLRRRGSGAEAPSAADPWAERSNVKRMFADVVAAAADADVVVSYLPVASMGSAVELHEAHKASRTIICIVSPKMSTNWVVRSYADVTVASIGELGALLLAAR